MPLQQNTKKVSYFSGCIAHNLVMIMNIFIFFAMILQTSSMAAAAAKTDQNPLQEQQQLSSREEFVDYAGYGEEKLSTVLITGTVVCEACLHGETQLHAWPISGALVSVRCQTGGKRSRTSSAQAITDEFGDFLIDLPSQLHAIPNLDKRCSVKVLRLPKNSVCRPAYARKQNALSLSSVGNGIRDYSAGTIKFLQVTSKPSQACNKRGNGDKQFVW